MMMGDPKYALQAFSISISPNGVSKIESGADTQPFSIAEKIKPKKAPSLTEVDAWFEGKIIPARTTRAGFSWNRIYKTPRDKFSGQREDPDGLCGDAVLYVEAQYERDFYIQNTSDGYRMARILWEGAVLNHTAIVMMDSKKIRAQKYEMKENKLVLAKGNQQYSKEELFKLHVYDLYYKKRTTVEKWWKDMDNFGGTILLGLEYDILEYWD